MPPVSNSSEVIGATAMPPSAAMIAARVKLNSVMRGTSMPISRAAKRFSAQARSAMPSRVRASRYQSATMISAAAPTIQKPWVGMRMPSSTTGASPEIGGKA